MPEVIINGPEGRIEARYHQSREEKAPVAIILHPHPQHGGTMNNKVAYNIYHAFIYFMLMQLCEPVMEDSDKNINLYVLLTESHV